MKELFEQAILSYNLPFTVAMCLMLLFWIVSALGALDLDVLDINLDADADTQVDASSFLSSLVKFVNAHEVPTTLVLSMLTVFMWMMSMLSNYYFNEGQSGMVALGLLAVNFIVSVIAVKYATIPFIPFMRALSANGENHEAILGKIGTVKSLQMSQQLGQVELVRQDGTVALLNAVLRDDEVSLSRGDKVLIYEKMKKGVYLVRKADEFAEEII